MEDSLSFFLFIYFCGKLQLQSIILFGVYCLFIKVFVLYVLFSSY